MQGPASGDLLEHVAGWLDRLSADPTAHPGGGPGRARFCRDASDWVRGVRNEMQELTQEFGVAQDFETAQRAVSERIARLAESARELAERAGRTESDPYGIEADAAEANQGDERPSPTSRRIAKRPEPPSSDPIDRARQLKAEVAEFRAKLREERQERAEAAAETRRQFVESIRRDRLGSASVAATPAAPEPEAEVPAAADHDAAPTPASEAAPDALEDVTPPDTASEPALDPQPVDLSTVPTLVSSSFSAPETEAMVTEESIIEESGAAETYATSTVEPTHSDRPPPRFLQQSPESAAPMDEEVATQSSTDDVSTDDEPDATSPSTTLFKRADITTNDDASTPDECGDGTLPPQPGGAEHIRFRRIG